MIFKKKHIITSKERKKNGIYILYTQHVFPTFSSFSPTARVIRFPLPPSLPLLPLFLFTPKHLKVQKESHHRRRNPPWPQLSEKSTRLRSMQSRGKHHHSILLFSAVCIFWKGEREKKCLSPWRINATPSRRRVHVGFKFRRHTFPLEAINSTWFRWWTRPVFVGLFHHSPPSNPNGNETAPSIPAHATARPIHRGWKQARKSSSTNVEPRCHNGHIAN